MVNVLPFDCYFELVSEGVFEDTEHCGSLAQRANVRKSLLKLFPQYKELGETTRTFLDKLVLQHKEYCLKMNNTTWTRQHNSFVLYYFNGMPGRQIALEQAIHRRTFRKDIDAVLDRMLIFILGFNGICWE